jgi:PAS domain S-box-containing protein
VKGEDTMLDSLLPDDEAERLAALRALRVLDTPPEERFERITRMARRLFATPVATIALVDADRLWFKSHQGLDLEQTARQGSFCEVAIQQSEALLVPDALRDARFAANSLLLLAQPLRFYAGYPLATPSGQRVGTLAIMDYTPRSLSSEDLAALRDLAAWAERELQEPTRRQRAREQLRLQSQALQAAANGIVITDSQGTIRWVNPAFTRLTGYSAREALGRNPRILKSGLQGPEVYRDLWATITAGQVWQGEIINRRRDGSLYTEEMTITPVPNDQGEIAHHIAIKQDISARKEAEARLQDALRQLQEQYTLAEQARSEARAILDADDDAVILVSPEGRVMTVDRTFDEMFYEGQPSALVGQELAAWYEDMERLFVEPQKLSAWMTAALADPQQTMQVSAKQQWPRMRELEFTSVPVRSSSAENLGRLFVLRDVTHQREVERMKNEFVSLVSHELRTPLTSIKGFTDLILDGDAGEVSEEQTEYLRIIQQNADRLVALINDLLDISRIESGRIKLERRALDMGAVVQFVVATLEPQIRAKGQSLAVELPPIVPPVLADHDRMVQVVTNLLSNAYKYTPAGGSISLAAHAEEDMLRVSVTDTGVGIAAEDQPKLFTRFYRVDNSLTREVGGTGLGLAIVKSIVEMHDGRVGMSSALGQGSTFFFTVPLAVELRHEHGAASDSAAPTGPLLAGVPAAAEARQILVVEDDPDIAHLLCRHLERAGYRVQAVTSAEQALQEIGQQRPDLITLDIRLPGMDGLALAERLGSVPETSAIPILIISIVQEEVRAVEGSQIKLGMLNALPKPIDQLELLKTIGRMLSQSAPQRVLVVDDDPGVQELLHALLSKQGYEVLTTGDGERGLALAASAAPGLVLLDLRLPGLDGLAVLRALKQNPTTASIPVIMMSGSDALKTGAQMSLLALGAADLISKPFDLDALLAEIHTITGR